MLLIQNHIGNLIDDATHSMAQGSSEAVDRIGLVVLAIIVVQAILSFFRVYWFVEVDEKSLAQIRKDLYFKLIRLPMEFFNQNRVGELSSRIAADLSQIQSSVTTIWAQSSRKFLFMIGGTVALALVSGNLTLIVLALMAVPVV